MTPRSSYVHIPFCRSKCFYCDFNSYPGLEDCFKPYVEALIKEITSAEPVYMPLETVYFGGGTPTVLPAASLVGILRTHRDHFGLVEDAEITVEANPGTVDGPCLEFLRRAGFNRLSIGVQSFNDSTLEQIGRIHTASDAREAVRAGRSAGFGNISIDLMYALPEQSASDWQETLRSALDLSPEHISLYELTIEEGAVFGNLRKRCQLQLPDEEIQIEMYLTAIEEITRAGYEHYEISNFALPGYRSRHNQTYWRNRAYFGFGAGASGYVSGVRFTNLKSPQAYIDAVESSGRAVESSETVTGRQAMGETIMLALRMIEGLDLGEFRERFGVDVREAYRAEIDSLAGRGLIELTSDRLRLSPAGLLVANDVSAEFV